MGKVAEEDEENRGRKEDVRRGSTLLWGCLQKILFLLRLRGTILSIVPFKIASPFRRERVSFFLDDIAYSYRS